ncbi:SusC/RagA family TonB-linked outer membrane protein [Bacteroidia bacterium]|nr:SusC/RagA family TonB-linked outer membrane protein [Bacteroidia bacterium]
MNLSNPFLKKKQKSFKGVILILFLLSISSTIKAQDQRITLPKKQITILAAFEEIEKQTSLNIAYNESAINVNRNISVDVTDQPLLEAMSTVLKGTNTTFRIQGKQILIVPVPATTPSKVYSGIIKDDKGEPVIGASVAIKGSQTGAITDIDGRFSINASAGSILSVSYIGFTSKEFKLGDSAELQIVIQEDNRLLDEVVVIGYGTQRRSDVTGAISSIGENALKEVPSINISQSMQGRVAGVSIQQTGTQPGADAQIRIRGTRSLTASNDPLIIVDGIPFGGKLNDIPSDDIKSVDILKDASSTAIYGSRGSNGVLLITTNRTNTYTKPQVSYNGYVGLSSIAKKYEMFDAEDFIKLRNLSGYQAGSPYLPQEQQYFTTGTSYDWQDEMYKTSSVNNHDLNFRAGNETLQSSLGLNYYNETSVLPGQDFTRYSLRGNIDLKLNNWFKIGYNTQNAFSLTNGEGVSIVALYEMLAFSPLVNPYDENGKAIVQPLAPREDSYSPLLLKDKSLWTQERKRFNTLNSLYAEIQFTPELKYRANLGLNYFHDQYGEFYSTNSPFKDGSTSSAALSLSTAYNYTIENLLYYDKAFALKHRVGATLMYSIEDSYIEYIRAEGLNMTADYMKYHNLGMANDGVTFDGNRQSYQRRTLLSYMGRINYSYDGKYMATFTLRSDGSSVLAKGKKWHTYPALSLAWNIRKESFMKNFDRIDLLKIRAGYGQTSNQSISPYATLGSLGQNKYNYGSDLVYGYYTSTLSNPNLGWEYTYSYNLGIDFSLWNRLSGSIDLYSQNTQDLLVSQRLPHSSGVQSSVMVNVGKTQNKGIEFSLHSDNFTPASKDGFAWKTDFNLYINRNKLVSLNSGITQDIDNGWFVGYPIDVIYDYKKLGIWQLGEEAEAAKFGFQPGDIKLEDYDKDGQLSQNDRYVIHKFEPDAELGMTNRFEYRNFDFTVVAFSQIGGTLVSSLHQTQSYLNVLNGVRNNLKVEYWREDNPTNDNPRSLNSGGARPYSSTLGYFDGSFLKIRTMTLGYSFLGQWLKSRNINNFRVYLTCNNVATLFSPYMKKGGIDPQPTGYGAQGVGNVSSPQKDRQLTITLSTPPTRQFLLGASITF